MAASEVRWNDGSSGPEEAARMRLEGEHRRGRSGGLGALHGLADHGAVAAMNAVEIADGDDRPDQPFEAGTLVAHDDERMGGVGFGHGGKAGLGHVWRRPQRYVNRFDRETRP